MKILAVLFRVLVGLAFFAGLTFVIAVLGVALGPIIIIIPGIVLLLALCYVIGNDILN